MELAIQPRSSTCRFCSKQIAKFLDKCFRRLDEAKRSKSVGVQPAGPSQRRVLRKGSNPQEIRPPDGGEMTRDGRQRSDVLFPLSVAIYKLMKQKLGLPRHSARQGGGVRPSTGAARDQRPAAIGLWSGPGADAACEDGCTPFWTSNPSSIYCVSSAPP